MALKKKTTRKPRTKRGILLTLLTLVIFILMLGEVITYVVLNINYDNLSSSVAQSLASGNFAQNLDSGMNAFLYSSLSKSIGIMAAFESDPNTRMGNFITNSSQVLNTLLYNGTFFNNTSYYNNSFKKAVKEFEAEALTDGFTANLSNVTVRIKQATPFRIGVYVTGLAALNTSSGISLDYPINANTTVSLNSKPSLIGIEQGLNGTLQKAQLPKAIVVENLTAKSGSTSPYMFVYGKVIYIPGEPTCSGISSTYENGNYILATPNAADIGQNVCGMGGLITNISNSSTPLKPYLVYKNDTVMSFLQTNPSLLLDGAALELLNTLPIQSSAIGGFYYASPYTASYLQRVDGEPYMQSSDGIFSFRSIDRNAANFSLTTQNISIPSLSKISGNTNATISAWIYIRSMPNHQIILSDDWSANQVLQMYVHTNGRLEADFGSGSAWIDAANTSAGTIKTGKWYFVSATWASGNGENIYVNGVKMPISYIVGNSLSTGTLGTPVTGDIANNQGNGGYFDGFIANEQIYNTALNAYQIEGQYRQGINSMPVSGSGLVAWYPLNSNANDYSGNGYNGVPTNAIYTNINGYTINPTEQQMQNYVSQTAAFNGTTSYINGNAFAFPLTATAWIYPTNYQSTASNLKTIMEFDGSPGSNGGNYQFFISRLGSSYCNGNPGELFLWNPDAQICTGLYVQPDKWSFV
ncbi:MAG: LamG domain-containing protein, partial [Candidatus Micrarchaeaceae archaeon]